MSSNWSNRIPSFRNVSNYVSNQGKSTSLGVSLPSVVRKVKLKIYEIKFF
jgi:hypothetical protein